MMKLKLHYILIALITVICCETSKVKFDEMSLNIVNGVFKNVDLLSRGGGKYSMIIYEIEDTITVSLSFKYSVSEGGIEFLEYYPDKIKFLESYRKTLSGSNYQVINSDSAISRSILELFTSLSTIGASSTSRSFRDVGIDRVFYLNKDNDRIYYVENIKNVSNEDWLEEISKTKRIGSHFYHRKLSEY